MGKKLVAPKLLKRPGAEKKRKKKDKAEKKQAKREREVGAKTFL